MGETPKYDEQLAELGRRRALADHSARPEAIERRRARGGRTARENLADLVDAGSFVEYGGLATAAQEKRLSAQDLLEQTPADGLIGGLARINGELFGDAAECAVLTYDYLVQAGTQGLRGHHKSDRLLDVIERLRLPTVFFTEGGGGRPNDTDFPVVSALDVRTFAIWARLAGVAPRIAIAAGRCFAGNAVLAASADLLIATKNSSIGVAGPAMLSAGGLGDHDPDEIGPISVTAQSGLVDVVVEDEAEAVAVARRLLGCFQGAVSSWDVADQALLHRALPEEERRAYDVRPVVTTLCDTDTVTFLGESHAPELVTALGRVEGRTTGFIANQTLHQAGSVTAAGGTKAARFLQLCDAFGIPVVSLVDTPGILGGPPAERSGVLRGAARMLTVAAQLDVPLVGVVLRRGYGLGAQAMLGGSTREPLITVAWPSAHLGPMNLEGAVRLGLRKELAELPADEREERVRLLTENALANASALNAARIFEIDDVIDPAETRHVIARAISASSSAQPRSL